MKMRRRNNFLADLRRRADGLGRFVVALFALASLTISGAPCFAMASAGGGAIGSAAVAEAPADDHGGHGHGYGYAGGHGGSSHAAGHPDDDPAQKPPPCPHCPLFGAMPGHAPSSTHSFCVALDEAPDQASPGPSSSLAKHVLSMPTYAPPPLIYHPPPTRWQRPIDARGAAIALNLEHCVLLI
jgi:hypothetical protein